MENSKEFNVAIVGVGGQGILTLAEVIIEAAFKQKYDVRMSEIHGLSQRGGGVASQIRFGEDINSSLIKNGHADLVIALEPLEALRAARFGSKGRTVFIINTHKIIPVSVSLLGEKYPEIDQIQKALESFSKEVIAIDATKIAKKEVGTNVVSNIHLLGLASAHGVIPIKKDVLLETIKETVPEKYFEMNKKIFELADR